jgi:hypothetical protein
VAELISFPLSADEQVLCSGFNKSISFEAYDQTRVRPELKIAEKLGSGTLDVVRMS